MTTCVLHLIIPKEALDQLNNNKIIIIDKLNNYALETS